MRIKQHQSPNASVRSPDFIADVDTGERREVDIGIHVPTANGETFIAIECRDRRAQQSVEWIEQLISKKKSVGANVLIAVTASSFSRPARIKALRHGVLLARLSSRLPQEMAALLNSLWLTARYLAPTVHSVQIQTQCLTPIRDDSIFCHKLAPGPLNLAELVQVWMNPNFIRALPKYVDDFSKAKFIKFQLIDINAYLIAKGGEIPITKAELVVELNYGEEELCLRGVQELRALDSQPIGEATAYDFGNKSGQLSEVIQDQDSGELRWDILAKPLLEEGKVLIGARLRSAQPVSITTMRLGL